MKYKIIAKYNYLSGLSTLTPIREHVQKQISSFVFA